jgi:hypothetical protein
MFLLLDAYWTRGRKEADGLAALLGSMALLPDGNSADPAQMEDWREAVDQVLDQRGDHGDQPWNMKLK